MEAVFTKSNSRTERNYSPLMYLHKIKRPGENYIVKNILLDDLPIIIFAFSSFGLDFGFDFICNILGIALLTFAFWCVYDYGYYENDYVAEKYEKDPVLSDSYNSKIGIAKWWQPWIWSLLLSLMGIVVLQANLIDIDLPFINSVDNSSTKVFIAFLFWLSFLLASRLTFYVYNHVNKQTRIWLYPLLQFSRYCGFLVLLPLNLIGACAILGQVFSRSVIYIVYRFVSANNWPKLQELFLRWIVFASILIMMACAQSNLDLIFSWQTLIISFWWLFKSRKQISQIIVNVEPIWINR